MIKPKKLLSKDIKDFSLSEMRKLGSELFKEINLRENNTMEEKINEYLNLINAAEKEIKCLIKEQY